MDDRQRCLIGERIHTRREALGLSLTEVAERISVAVSTVQRYEKGRIEHIKLPVVAAIARVLRVRTDWLLGLTDDMTEIPVPVDLPAPRIAEEVVTFPVIGEVAAGYEHLAAERWDGDTVDIPAAFLHGRPKSDFFVLSVHGDSMYPLYMNGDKVLVQKADTLDRSGQIGLILYNNDEATLKRIEYAEGEDWLCMVPVNPLYPPRRIEGEELAHCRIIGIPRLLIREIDQ